MRPHLCLFLWSLCAGAAIEPKIIYEQDPALLNTTIQIVVTAGASDDPLEHAGLSKLLSELMPRGTKKRPRQKFQSEVELLGAAIDGSASHSNIVFTSSVIKENTDRFLVLLEDFLLNPALEDVEFEKLRTETIGEINHQKNNNSRLAGLALRKEVFAGTPLERPVIGILSSIKNIKRDDVLKKYNNQFHRGNVFFAVASALPEQAVKKSLTAIWLKLPDGLRQSRRVYPVKFPPKPTITLIHKPKTEAGAFMMGQSGITIEDPDRFTVQVGNFSFGGEPLVSRLFRIVRGELGYTYSIGSTYGLLGNLTNQKGVFAIHSTPSVEFTLKTLMKTLSLWEDYLKNGLSSAELKLAKESIINSYPFEFDSAGARLSQKIEEYLYSDPILSPEDFEKKIGSITDRDLKKALKDKHTAKGFIITLLADETVIRQQLEEEQKLVASGDRLQINKVITPEQLID